MVMLTEEEAVKGREDVEKCWGMGYTAEDIVYLDRSEALKLEPELGPQVIGVKYYPKDASVNPKRLIRVLSILAK
jgi:glycine/D-amino acid oxidase-like deaminating enzyme